MGMRLGFPRQIVIWIELSVSHSFSTSLFQSPLDRLFPILPHLDHIRPNPETMTTVAIEENCTTAHIQGVNLYHSCSYLLCSELINKFYNLYTFM